MFEDTEQGQTYYKIENVVMVADITYYGGEPTNMEVKFVQHVYFKKTQNEIQRLNDFLQKAGAV